MWEIPDSVESSSAAGKSVWSKSENVLRKAVLIVKCSEWASLLLRAWCIHPRGKYSKSPCDRQAPPHVIYKINVILEASHQN